MARARLSEAAPLCLVCGAPVDREDIGLTLHCSRRCHLVWTAELQLQWSDSRRPLDDGISEVLQRLHRGEPLDGLSSVRLQTWLASMASRRTSAN